MTYLKQTLGGAFGLVAILALGGGMAACSDDNPGEQPSGTGGSGTGGKASGGSGGRATNGGSGGKMTGGAGGATGGSGGKATGGSGGKATGGTGGVSAEGGVDADAGCHAPQVLVFDQPGCSASVKPVCAGPLFDACAITACACDGETIEGCGNYEKRWAHLGPCTDGGDGGPKSDAGDSG